jgi:cytochrome c551/c552
MRLFRRIYTHVKDGSVLGEGGDPKKSQGTYAAKQCFACHQAKKEQDYVDSAYIP